MIKIYEVVDFSHGNTDFLSDFEDTSDIRYSMIAHYPQSVEEDDKIKKSTKFIEKRNKYPSEKVGSFDKLTEMFKTVTGNYSKAINLVENKKQFVDNLYNLKEYLNKHGIKETLNEDDSESPELPRVRKMSLDNEREYADELITKTLEKLKLPTTFQFLGGGGNGYAYRISADDVIKITVDGGEVDTAIKLLNKSPKYLAHSRGVYRIIDTEKNTSFYIIFNEFIPGKNSELFTSYRSKFTLIEPYGYDFGKLFYDYLFNKTNFDYDATIKIINGVLTENERAGVSDVERKKIYNFMVGLANIKQELVEYGSKSLDFTVFDNLGYKNGVLKYFDYGGYREPNPDINKNNYIFLEEIVLSENDEYHTIFDKIASNVQKQLKIDRIEKLSSGNMGSAYDIVGKEMVLKITRDRSEAYSNKQLLNKKPKYLARPYRVFDVVIKNQNANYYAIIMEKVNTDPTEFTRLMNRLKFVFSGVFDIGLVDVFEYYVYGNEPQKPINKEKLLNYMTKNKEDGWFFQSLLRIGKELVENNISSIDFLNPRNLGFRDKNTVVFFDIGMSDYVGETILDEDGSSLFSTDNSYGQDDYPTYNKDNLPPDIENNLDANSAMYERKMGWVDGSETVEVKKKCRLGGLGNTSSACNQGDINNLIMKKIK